MHSLAQRSKSHLRCNMIRLMAIIAFLMTGIASAAIKLPQGPHRDLVYGKCRTCHDLGYLQSSKGITKAQWNAVLSDMESYGLEVTKQQKQEILSYLGSYLGPNPPTVSTKTAQGGGAMKVSGKEVFSEQCSSCHQANGQGIHGEFPPLAANPDLYRSREFPVLVVLNGLHGKIKVNGTTYNGQMPSFDFLSNDKLVAVIHFVRNSWGNKNNRPKDMKAITGNDIITARKQQLSPAQVHTYRKEHGGK
jgi:mono/diheme cytochrome c family protein